MSRPRTQAEYLARLIPPSVQALSRRAVITRALGAGALLGLGGSLAACGDDDDSGGAATTSGGTSAAPTTGASGTTAAPGTTVAAGTTTGGTGGGAIPAASGTITLGSNASDDVPKGVLASLVKAFTDANPDADVPINTIEHETFQENISNYLQGNPDDVWTWFAGYRMQFFAERGLAGDISDVWKNLTGYTDAFKNASTSSDGKQYFVPQSYYPWAVFFRKSVWDEKGYEIPTTFDEMNTLAATMQDDGLIPFAFADKDGWPAMGTFDILNMRINGYDFHISLMAGDESWESAEVKNVFDTWRGILPLHQPDSLGRTWQEAAQSLVSKEAGMYLLGMFVSEQFPEADREDVDFFKYPELDSNIGSGAIDAPIDGMMMAPDPDNEEGAKALLTWFGSDGAGTIINTENPGAIAANSGADTSMFNDLKNRAVELVGSADAIAQFLDRDTRPDFASTVMIPSLQEFIRNPDDIDGLTKSIEEQKKSIFTD
jgi:multiple sugar transport system substrate-binding protein